MTRPEEVSDDMLMALADGELHDPDAEQLLQRLAADPVLAARFADFMETRALLQAAFPPEPVPERLIAAALSRDFAKERVVPLRKRNFHTPFWGIALAASVVLAVAGFWSGRSLSPSAPVALNVGSLAAILPTGRDLRLADGHMLRVLASYDTDLGLCRIIAQGTLRHVTCRPSGTSEWVTALTVQAGGTETFQPASEIALGLIDSFLDDLSASSALTTAEEQRRLAQ